MLILAHPQPRYHANARINRLGFTSSGENHFDKDCARCSIWHGLIYVENVGGGKERVQEMNTNEEVRKERKDLKRIECEREHVTDADAMMLSKDSLDSLEERGLLKLEQSLKVEAWNVDNRPKLESELDRIEERGMLKLEHNLEVNQKLPTRRNLSFRSKKQPIKTQSIDSAGISGTELEK